MENILPTNNQFFTGALWIAIVGSIATSVYYVAQELYDLFIRSFVISVTIDNKNEAFKWITRWVGEDRAFLSAQNLSLNLSKQQKKWYEDEKDDDAQLEFLPGPGYHLFFYKNQLMWLYRYSSDKVTTTGFDNKPFIYESVSLSTFGRDKKVFEDLFVEAKGKSIDKDKGKTKIYILDEWGSDWTVALSKPPRPLDSVVLDENLSKELITDAREFLSRSKWYQDMGLPYRRGYLFYGPPGCGKTSFIQCLAGELKLNICVLNLSSNHLDDQVLNQRLVEVPANCCIVLEDVDAVFVDRNTAQDAQYNGGKKVTFSGLLNAIDGVASQEGKLFFMTTNHIEKLDGALIRPGRCDVKKFFGFASKSQILELFSKFYPGKQELGKKLLEHVPSNSFTMATLQKHFVEHLGEPEKAIQNSHLLVDENLKENDETINISNWLKRLGLSHHVDSFHKQKVYHLDEIKDITENTLSRDFGVKLLGEQNLIIGMLQGHKDILRGFELCPKETVQKYCLEYAKKFKNQEKFVEECSDKYSHYELMQFFEKYKDSPYENIEFLKNPPTEPSKHVLSLKEWIDKTKLNSIFYQKYEEKKEDEDEKKEEEKKENGETDKKEEENSRLKNTNAIVEQNGTTKKKPDVTKQNNGKDAPKKENSKQKKEKKKNSQNGQPKIQEKENKVFTIYDKLISEDIIDEEDVSGLSESDFENYGIKLKGSLIKVMKEVEKLKEE